MPTESGNANHSPGRAGRHGQNAGQRLPKAFDVLDSVRERQNQTGLGARATADMAEGRPLCAQGR